MMKVLQRIFGSNNTQILNLVESQKSIDILPQELDEILDYITDDGSPFVGDLSMVKPNLTAKNSINSIDEEQFKIIKEDAVFFSDIENCLRNDSSHAKQKKYKLAAKILNIQYINTFNHNFPEFVVQSAKAFNSNGEKDSVMTLKFVALLHYMYTECDIGIRP